MGDVKFNIYSAEQLIQNMRTYCTNIQKEAQDILKTLKNEGLWNDRQTKAFEANMTEIAKDMEYALSMESEYMRTYLQRIQELRG